MNGLPFRAQVFLWLVLGAAAAVVSAAVGSATAPLVSVLGLTRSSDIITSVMAMAGIVITGLYPICLGNKIRTSLSAVITFTAALLFPPLRAVVITLPSVLAYTYINARRSGWPAYYYLFNAAQVTLNTGSASLLFHRLKSVHSSLLNLDNLTAIGVVTLVVVAYFLVNSGLVATMSALTQKKSVVPLWLSMYRGAWQRNISVLLLGVAMAIIYSYAPLGVLLFTIPLIVIHQAYSHAVLVQTQAKETLETLADVIDKRDPYTFAHSKRVAEYARLTAGRLGLSQLEQEAIALAARVHDLGKIGVRDELLNHPGQLSQPELAEVRRHTLIGAEIVSRLVNYARSKDAILYHHERWDGSGANRLAYEHIPIGARIIAVADAFDAMTSERPYRSALTRENAWQELEKGKGAQFDPVVVEAFVEATRDATVTSSRPVSERDALPPGASPAPQVRH